MGEGAHRRELLADGGYLVGGALLVASAFLHWISRGAGSGLRGHALVDAVVALGKHVPALSSGRLTVLWYLVPALGAASWNVFGVLGARTRATRIAAAVALVAVLIADGAFRHMVGSVRLGRGPKVALLGGVMLALSAHGCPIPGWACASRSRAPMSARSWRFRPRSVIDRLDAAAWRAQCIPLSIRGVPILRKLAAALTISVATLGVVGTAPAGAITLPPGNGSIAYSVAGTVKVARSLANPTVVRIRVIGAVSNCTYNGVAISIDGTFVARTVTVTAHVSVQTDRPAADLCNGAKSLNCTGIVSAGCVRA